MHADGITVLVPLSTRRFKGEFALIDIEDAERVLAFNWSKHSGGYAYKDRSLLLHRFILDLDDTSTHLLVDHINRNKLDNRKGNLRLATKSQNAMNSKVRVDNATGFRGVSFRNDTGKWVYQIGSRAKARWRGECSTAEEAALAYDAIAREIWGEFAQLNFPPSPEVP
jgi:hypothetical protein